MQVTKKKLTDTKVQLKLEADEQLLSEVKQQVLREFARSMKIQGFREGKAPLHLVEKNADPTRLQSEFLDHAMNRMYGVALEQENLRPVDQPQVKITKFVPFSALELEAEVDVVGDIKLPDYKKMKQAREKVTVAAKEVDEVIQNLLARDAERKEVDRAAKNGDEAVIDFTGADAKTKENIAGADGKAYSLLLGSGSFIPGFEDNVVGLKPGDTKTFVVTFPKDYGVTSLQNRKVEFTVQVTKVNEVVEPKLDDAFAAKVGPFKTVAELKDDIKKELLARKESEAGQKYADELLTKLTEKSTVALPEVLVDEQLDRLEQDERQNLLYRGQTWEEFLKAEGLTAETYRAKQRPAAELRVKAGLVLGEVAEQEKLAVTTQELEAQLAAMKARYTDPKMQAELAKPEARRSIASRMLTEKTIAKLVGYASTE